MTLNSGKRDRAEQTYTCKCKEMQNNLVRRRVKEFRLFIETKLTKMLKVQKTAVRRSNVNIVASKFTTSRVTSSIRNADHFLWKWFSIAIVKTEYEYFTIDWKEVCCCLSVCLMYYMWSCENAILCQITACPFPEPEKKAFQGLRCVPRMLSFNHFTLCWIVSFTELGVSDNDTNILFATEVSIKQEANQLMFINTCFVHNTCNLYIKASSKWK